LENVKNEPNDTHTSCGGDDDDDDDDDDDGACPYIHDMRR
jgi:hypothetical protein